MLVLISIWNFLVFIIYAYDKIAAIKNKIRISEKNLLLFAFLFGGVGALCAMQLFRHKTKHIKFLILVPVSFIITIVVSFLICGQ